MTNPITREKCLELFHAATGKEIEIRKPSWTYYISEQTIESLVRASVALGMEMAAKECQEKMREFDADRKFDCQEEQPYQNRFWGAEECFEAIRKLAEEVTK